ncbi:MAG TPA: type II toxin-antitoxin system death-on-curing family toxin [Ramlibacter sp.]|uniref:type II toxin-antitoxin system death-on-curing family toxin n=1 Tax=Ramlibacter sp. TaxID=1917967 RepID=UPI002BC05AD9|nr:type II toxin-antitoxin system death-on-curing family toxin [Ramlibacter sp.]HVZ46642.1 type II toxin-antitoxin system death-on-curing family toxin [Ramlibacter sp.]
MKRWVWLQQEVILAVHEAQLAEHGGGTGTRDPSLIESALVRAENLHAYGEPDFADLAAAYGFGLSRNHPFVDGNKRTAFVATELFLSLNGYVLAAEDSDAVLTMLAVAAGDITEAEFASWIRSRSVEIA